MDKAEEERRGKSLSEHRSRGKIVNYCCPIGTDQTKGKEKREKKKAIT